MSKPPMMATHAFVVIHVQCGGWFEMIVDEEHDGFDVPKGHTVDRMPIDGARRHKPCMCPKEDVGVQLGDD